MNGLPRFNVIIATDTNGGFSYNNKLPWKFKKDSNFYQTITSSNISLQSNILIMGRKTWESMNYIIPKNRIVFVITSDYENYMKKYENDNKSNDIMKSKTGRLFFFASFEKALKCVCSYKQSIIWVVGGLRIYDEALKHVNCASIYLTQINGIFKTDRTINLKDYNITWSNIHIEQDINDYDKKEYELKFMKGFINKH
jgi:dihydrofolate reductase